MFRWRKFRLDCLSVYPTNGTVNYFIYFLGEINSLAEASPAQRLKLLEDFAGTTIHKVTFISSLFYLSLLIIFVRQPPFRKPFPCGLFIKNNKMRRSNQIYLAVTKTYRFQ
jgi:hypothetical protein